MKTKGVRIRGVGAVRRRGEERENKGERRRRRRNGDWLMGSGNVNEGEWGKHGERVNEWIYER